MEEKELKDAVKEVLSGASLSSTAKKYDMNKGHLAALVQGYRLASPAASALPSTKDVTIETSNDNLPQRMQTAKGRADAPSADTWTIEIPNWLMIAGIGCCFIFGAGLVFFLR